MQRTGVEGAGDWNPSVLFYSTGGRWEARRIASREQPPKLLHQRLHREVKEMRIPT